MDEPLGALDRKLRAHMQLELKRIQRAVHVTVVYVTHDQEEALTMSDAVAVMRGGRVEQLGTPAELYEAPVSPFVADFVGESNFIDGTVVSVTEAALARPDRRGARVLGNAGRAARRGPARDGGHPAREDGDGRGAVRRTSIAPRASSPRSCTWAMRPGTASSLGAAGTVTVKIQNRMASRPYSVGDPIELLWDPRQTRLFRGGP